MFPPPPLHLEGCTPGDRVGIEEPNVLAVDDQEVTPINQLDYFSRVLKLGQFLSLSLPHTHTHTLSLVRTVIPGTVSTTWMEKQQGTRACKMEGKRN